MVRLLTTSAKKRAEIRERQDSRNPPHIWNGWTISLECPVSRCLLRPPGLATEKRR
jgi:hypothetical protein